MPGAGNLTDTGWYMRIISEGPRAFKRGPGRERKARRPAAAHGGRRGWMDAAAHGGRAVAWTPTAARPAESRKRPARRQFCVFGGCGGDLPAGPWDFTCFLQRFHALLTHT